MNAPAEPPRPFVAIVGPTASGKSALALRLAAELGAEIVACDSTQVYRGFDIGTAKPAPAERGAVPHHLLDLLEPAQVFTAGDYRRRALDVLKDLRSRGRLPVFTVGTGLYFRALVEGLADAPGRSEDLRARLRKRADSRGPEYLHRVLMRLDRQAAARIAPRDANKLIRAIEVCVLAGKPISKVHGAGRLRLEGFTVIKLGLMPPRAELYERIHARTEAMLAAGWLDEVKRLVDAGVPPESKPFQFIGYRELRAHLEAVVPLEKAVRAIQQATRRYAKRQITWFRREPAVEWFNGFGDDPKTVGAAVEHLNKQLRAGPRARDAAGV
jgi:tRNA dimethylallyltransferase